MPASGSAGYIGIATESIPGGSGTPNTWVSPTQWLKAETNGVKSQAVASGHDVFRNDRNTKSVPRLTKMRHGGAIGYGAYPRNGGLLLPAALGTDAFLAAIANDVVASNTTALGMTTNTLTTGTGSWKPGAVAIISSDAGEEPLLIYSYSGSSSKHLVTSAWTLAHTGTIDVRQLATHYTQRTTGTYRKSLRTISAEIDTGDLYSYMYSGGQVDTLTMTGSPTKVDLSADLKFQSRTKNPSPTAYDESDATLADLAFEWSDGFAVFSDDPTSSGTSTVQRADLGQDWMCAIKNSLKEESPFNRSRDFVYYPQQRVIDLKFKYLIQADRPVGWEDFMLNEVDTSFQAMYAYKAGGVWYAFAVRFPTIRYLDSSITESLNATVAEEIAADVRVANGQPDMEVFVSNGDVAAW